MHPAGLALIDQALVSGSNFLLLLASARCLSVTDFGQLSLAWAVLIFFSNLHQALVLQPLAILLPGSTRSAAGRHLCALEHGHRWLFLTLPLLLAAWWSGPAWLQLHLIAVFTALTRAQSDHQRRVGYVVHDSLRALLVDVVTHGPVCVLALGLWLHPTPLAPEWFLLGAAVPALLGWAVGIVLFQPLRQADGPLPWRTLVADHGDVGRWLLVGVLALYASNQLFPFLIAGQLGLLEVAVFSAANGIMGGTHVVMAGIEAYGVPQLRTAYVQQGRGGLFRSSLTMGAWCAACVMPLCLIGMLFPEAILRALYDQRYVDQAWLLRALGAIYLLISLNRFVCMILLAMKEARATAVAQVVCAILTVVTCPPAIQHGGLVGVVWVLAANTLLSLVIAVLWMWRIPTHDSARP